MTNYEQADEKHTEDPFISDCSVCRQLRLEGPDEHTFVVVPARGGGWHAWSVALLRLFQRMSSQPTQAVIISQPGPNSRYVQAQIGHGIAHAEVSSNVYLSGEWRLSEEYEALLLQLGWLAPLRDHDDPHEMPSNWHLPRIHGDWPHLVEMFLAVMVGLLEFDEYLPVEVRSFMCANPCRACSWPADEISTLDL